MTILSPSKKVSVLNTNIIRREGFEVKGKSEAVRKLYGNFLLLVGATQFSLA